MSSLNSQLWKGRQTIQYGNTTIEYDLVKSRRVKTSEIIVDENNILIRTPFDKSQFEIDKLLEGKAKWIVEKQREYREHQKKISKPTYRSESTLPYLGKNRKLEIRPNHQEKPTLVFNEGKFIFLSPDNSISQIKQLYENWLYERAMKVFSKKVRKYSEELNIEVKKIVVKNLKNRWGSVTKNGVINLNLHLLKAPKNIIDYIIVHELCHFLVKGHSYRFWVQVIKIIPSYKESIAWLAMNANSLIE
jgi:predicted metal-dependent hydrolase